MNALRFLWWVWALAMFADPVAAQPKLPTIPLEPSGKWVIEFEDNRCTAGQAYALPNGEVALGIEPLPTRSSTSIILQFPSDLKGLDQWTAKIIVGTTVLPPRSLLAIPSTRAGMARYSFSLDDKEFAQLINSRFLSVEGGPIRVALRTRSLPAVADTLRKCVSLILVDWGLPLDRQASLASFPQTKSRIAFDSDDYPVDAVTRSAVGEIMVRVWVDEHGAPSNCAFVLPSGHADLDAATCKGALKTKFVPALDKAGKPLPSPAMLVVRWLTQG